MVAARVYNLRMLPAALSTLLLCLAPGPFTGYEEGEAATGKLHWKGWSEADRQLIVRSLPEVLARVELRLGRRLSRSFTTVLTPNGFELRRLVREISGTEAPASPIAGVAIPRAGVLIVSGDLYSAAEPLRTLEHEVAHLVLNRLPAARIPRWLDEGIACWVSGEVLAPQDEAYLAFLARLNGLYPLATLELRFPAVHEPRAIAYQESLLFIQYLVERFGAGMVPALLDAIEQGAEVGAALAHATKEAAGPLEEAFRLWVRGRASLLGALASVISFWTLAAVLACVAIARHLVRRRQRLKALDEPGPPEPVPPGDPEDSEGL